MFEFVSFFDFFVVVEQAWTAINGQEALRGLIALSSFPFAFAKAVDVRDHVAFLGLKRISPLYDQVMWSWPCRSSSRKQNCADEY